MKRVALEPGKCVVMHVDRALCATDTELLSSDILLWAATRYAERLFDDDSPLLEVFDERAEGPEAVARRLVSMLGALATRSIASAPADVVGAPDPARRETLWRLVEGLYDHWRAFDRFLVCHTDEPFHGDEASRPHRRFNESAERLQAMVRGIYRDIEENITGDHPRVYRQVAAAWNVGVLAAPGGWEPPAKYRDLIGAIPVIRQVIMSPPLILDPPSNTRTGRFEQASEDPLAGLAIDPSRWLCYPAQVGSMVVFVYIHQSFIGLGCALANLFELADERRIAAGPDAVYLFGAPPEQMARFGDLPTVFFDDPDTGLLVGAVPAEPRFGYFGYLKKMTLTLHNIAMMKRGRMPFHGALTRVVMRDGKAATILLMGDTATGKSETYEALRVLGHERIRELRMVADDMGSIEVADDGGLRGYGTEVGAFIRLDDLQKGYAWEQVDRAVIMSPQKVNARVVLPVTTVSEVVRGYPIDVILYANNHEQVDDAHRVLERFDFADAALADFRDGAAMSKGTTTSTGLTHGYFANPFGPAQLQDLHEPLARRVFDAAFERGLFVGQLRTRLGIEGMETEGPAAAARALVDLVEGEVR